VLRVEDWAEVRRLHRAEGMPIKAIARVMGCSKNTVKRALAADGPPRYERVAWVGGGRGRAADPGAAGGLADDAGDGDRRADRLDPGVDGAQGPGAGAAASVSAAGSGLADGVCGWRSCPVRPVVPERRGAGGVRPDPPGVQVAGAGDGDRLCPLAVGQVVAVALCRGLVRGLVAVDRPAWGGAAGAGLGWRGRGRPATPQGHRPDRGRAWVPGGAGRQDLHLQSR
jgi:Helix-turn-helix domain of resolvase